MGEVVGERAITPSDLSLSATEVGLCLHLEGEAVEDFGFPCKEVRWEEQPVVSVPPDVEIGAQQQVVRATMARPDSFWKPTSRVSLAAREQSGDHILYELRFLKFTVKGTGQGKARAALRQLIEQQKQQAAGHRPKWLVKVSGLVLAMPVS
ncbi:unnamed protein product [Symbiodinium pilosum]|uniref:Uncharacterized protein n=1 Tax=Symbiodinium pilosum TaxID=2952 RepID=A0A812MCP0_SYMPI|nr:unnamed protein product [Symbiodinium pilosum]